MAEQNEQTNEDFFPLDDATIAMIGEVRDQMKALDNQLKGALNLYLRQHKLSGLWNVAENGRELRRMPEQVVAPGPKLE